MKADMKDPFPLSCGRTGSNLFVGPHRPQFGASTEEHDLVSYRARQQLLMQIADELILIEVELRGVTASTENSRASEADSPQASRGAFPAALLARLAQRLRPPQLMDSSLRKHSEAG